MSDPPEGRPGPRREPHGGKTAMDGHGKLKGLRREVRFRLNRPVGETGQWLRSVLNGYYRYHAVPRNLPAMMSFYRRVGQLWHRTLERRSHKGRVDWRRMYRLINRWLPTPRVMHPYPEHRRSVTTRGRSPVR